MSRARNRRAATTPRGTSRAIWRRCGIVLRKPTGSPRFGLHTGGGSRIAGLLAAVAVWPDSAGLFIAGKRSDQKAIPDFQRLTFGRGMVSSARFAPDGRTIVYSAAWDGEPIRLFSDADGRTRVDAASDLPDGDARLGVVSGRDRDAARCRFDTDWGTLARVPLTGGAPREMIEGVVGADWSPDGKSLADRSEPRGKVPPGVSDRESPL